VDLNTGDPDDVQLLQKKDCSKKERPIQYSECVNQVLSLIQFALTLTPSYMNFIIEIYEEHSNDKF